MVIMSARGLVTAQPLCGPHSPHSHLHFHWQLFSPHKKFNTPICEPCSAKEKCGIGPESSCFKSQLIVPLSWEGPGRLGGWEDPQALGPHICPFAFLGLDATQLKRKGLIQSSLQSFGHLRRFCISFYGRAIPLSWESDYRGEDEMQKGKEQNKLVGHFTSKSHSEIMLWWEEGHEFI